MTTLRLAVLDCAGAPRDLGLDQGGAEGERLRAWALERGGPRAVRPERGGILLALAAAISAGGSRRWGARDAALAALARDVERHFPQLAERLDGLALGARVSRELLLRALRPELGDAASGAPEAALGSAVGVRARDGAVLLLVPMARGAFGLRRSRPENGLRSLELATPWGVGGLAGVNESGLAVAVAPGVGATAPRPWPRCAAPATLLVQECLQRFGDVAGATAWCRTRPAGGAARIWLADASGALAAVALDGDERGVPAADADSLGPAALGAPDLETSLAALREHHGAAARAAALQALRAAASARGTPAAVALDPAARAVDVLADGDPGAPDATPRCERVEV